MCLANGCGQKWCVPLPALAINPFTVIHPFSFPLPQRPCKSYVEDYSIKMEGAWFPDSLLGGERPRIATQPTSDYEMSNKHSFKILFLSNLYTQCRAPTHNTKIKSRMLHWASQVPYSLGLFEWLFLRCFLWIPNAMQWEAQRCSSGYAPLSSRLKAMLVSHLGYSSRTSPPHGCGPPVPMSQGTELPSQVQSTQRITSDNKMTIVLSFGEIIQQYRTETRFLTGSSSSSDLTGVALNSHKESNFV